MNDKIEMPPYRQLMWPTVKALRELGGSATVHEITDFVVNDLSLSEKQQHLPREGDTRTELEYRLAWARTALKNDGAIINSSRGVWTLTIIGETANEQGIEEIYAAVREAISKRGRGKREHDAQAASKAEKLEPEPEEDVDFEDEWKQHLLETLLQMESYAFERLCQRLLRESGFESVEVTKQSGDGGIDGVGVLQVNLVTFRVVFECKRHRNNVGAPIIQAFRGAMVGRGEKGLVITTGSFTREARKESVRAGAPSIDLVDGDRLCDLLKNLGLGVSTEMVERVNIDRDWFLRV